MHDHHRLVLTVQLAPADCNSEQLAAVLMLHSPAGACLNMLAPCRGDAGQVVLAEESTRGGESRGISA